MRALGRHSVQVDSCIGLSRTFPQALGSTPVEPRLAPADRAGIRGGVGDPGQGSAGRRRLVPESVCSVAWALICERRAA